MNLSEYDWPEVTGVEMVFCTFQVPPELLKEARDQGYYRGNKKGNKMFSQLFYGGGELLHKKNLQEWQKKALTWCLAFMRSWNPKHEEKDAIASMILEECLEGIKKK